MFVCFCLCFIVPVELNTVFFCPSSAVHCILWCKKTWSKIWLKIWSKIWPKILTNWKWAFVHIWSETQFTGRIRSKEQKIFETGKTIQRIRTLRWHKTAQAVEAHRHTPLVRNIWLNYPTRAWHCFARMLVKFFARSWCVWNCYMFSQKFV